MANPWFKFYASDYLNEVKLKGVDANKRSCLVTALCHSATNGGKIDTRFLTSDLLKIDAGVRLGGADWDEVGDIYQWFASREFGGMEGHYFVFKNWQSRQDSYLTPAEKMKKHREQKVTNVTLEENREDKNREENTHTRRDWLTHIPHETLRELGEKYEASPRQIQRKGEELLNYCLAKGKTYKNYRAFLENALNRDFGRRLPAAPKVEEKRPLTADERAALERISSSMRVK